jgi:hypothetical protein
MDSASAKDLASRDVVSRTMTLRFVRTWLRTKKDHVSIIVLLLYVMLYRFFVVFQRSNSESTNSRFYIHLLSFYFSSTSIWIIFPRIS